MSCLSIFCFEILKNVMFFYFVDVVMSVLIPMIGYTTLLYMYDDINKYSLTECVLFQLTGSMCLSPFHGFTVVYETVHKNGLYRSFFPVVYILSTCFAMYLGVYLNLENVDNTTIGFFMSVCIIGTTILCSSLVVMYELCIYMYIKLHCALIQ